MRIFEGGATRDGDEGKHDYEGFMSPLVVKRFGEYMTKSRILADGSVRDSDNWQKGIPQDQYIKSGFRHFVTWWLDHRGLAGSKYALEETLCALMFNVMGYLHEHLKQSDVSCHNDDEKVV